MLTVSIPTYRTPPPLLARAIRSVLDQTYRDLRLVVVNDGGPPITIPRGLARDDRLVVYESDGNRGRYWCDAAVLAATTDGWFAVHDADDWSEADRFARLITVAEPSGAAVAHYWRHQIDGRDHVAEPNMHRPDGRLHHLVHWCSGVYSVDRMEKAGGIHPRFRVGFDTLHTLMIQLTGDIEIDPVPGYHWCRRRGGLSTARDTRQGSTFRHRARRMLETLYRDAYSAMKYGDDPGEVIRSDVPPPLRDEVERHADKIRGLLDERR